MVTSDLRSYLLDITSSFQIYGWTLEYLAELILKNPVTAVFVGLLLTRYVVFLLAYFFKLILDQ